MANVVIDGFAGTCVCCALAREAAPLRRRCHTSQRLHGAPFLAWFATLPIASQPQVLLLAPGVGKTALQAALHWLFNHAKPQLLISAGFAGALQPGLPVGSVVVPGLVINEAGQAWSTSFGEVKTRLLSTDHLVATPAEKTQLHGQFNAVAVDMESATLAQRCHEAGVPFGVIRSISDSVETALAPRLVTLLAGGAISPWRVVWNCLRYPGLIPHCIRLGRDTHLAAKNLGEALISKFRTIHVHK